MRTESQVAAMSCPVCRVPLSMSDRQGIEIDYCPQCRGVWLDRGELDKIIERSTGPAQTQSPPPPPPPQAQSAPPPSFGHAPPMGGQHHYHFGKRKKHWLNEIFD